MEKIQNALIAKSKRFLSSIGDMRLRSEYSATVKIYDAKDIESDKCTHTLNGSSDHSLVKLAATGMLLSIATVLTCSVCSLLRKS